MREPLGTAIGLALGTLLYDWLRGRLDGGSLYRAGVAFLLSFVLLVLLAAFRQRSRD
jgi:hypothetical protein